MYSEWSSSIQGDTDIQDAPGNSKFSDSNEDSSRVPSDPRLRPSSAQPLGVDLDAASSFDVIASLLVLFDAVDPSELGPSGHSIVVGDGLKVHKSKLVKARENTVKTMAVCDVQAKLALAGWRKALELKLWNEDGAERRRPPVVVQAAIPSNTKHALGITKSAHHEPSASTTALADDTSLSLSSSVRSDTASATSIAGGPEMQYLDERLSKLEYLEKRYRRRLPEATAMRNEVSLLSNRVLALEKFAAEMGMGNQSVDVQRDVGKPQRVWGRPRTRDLEDAWCVEGSNVNRSQVFVICSKFHYDLVFSSSVASC